LFISENEKGRRAARVRRSFAPSQAAYEPRIRIYICGDVESIRPPVGRPCYRPASAYRAPRRAYSSSVGQVPTCGRLTNLIQICPYLPCPPTTHLSSARHAQEYSPYGMVQHSLTASFSAAALALASAALASATLASALALS